MIPAERIQAWAATFAPSDLGLAVIVAGIVCGLLFSALRARAALVRSLPLLAYFIAAVLLVRYRVELPALPWSVAAAAAAGSLLLHLRFGDRDGAGEARAGGAAVAPRRAGPIGLGELAPSIEDPFRPLPAAPPASDVPPAPSRWARALLWLGLAATAVLLFDDLRGYAGTLLAWESPVSQGFAAALDGGAGFWRFLGERFLWDDGVLSAGHTSLFFGPPTYALMRWAAATPWTLRVASAVATLLATALLFRFARRQFDRTTAIAATLFFGLNTPVIFYGRYGSSIAGSLLAVVLAFHATWLFLEGGRRTLLKAALCGAALFVATLQYAPARLAVLFLLCLIPFALLSDRRRATWTQWAGVLVIVAMAGGVWAFETANRREHYFLHARGEQVFGLFRNPNTIPALVGIDRGAAPAVSGALDREAKLEIVRMVVRKTFGELVELVSANPSPRARGAVVTFDPPPMSLYFAPLAALVLLGLARSLTRWRSWRYSAFVLFALGYCGVLLFTNRVDPHRGILLVIPLAIWFGLGVREVGEQARRLRVPRAVSWLLALGLAISAIYSDVYVRYSPGSAPGATAETIAAEMEAIDGSVWFWFARDHREVAWLGLRLLDERLRSGKPAGGVLPQAITDGLRADKGGPRQVAIREGTRLGRQGTLLLGPRTMFLEAAQQLQAAGLRVAERKAHGYPYFRVDGGARRTKLADAELLPLLSATPAPTPAPLVLTRGRKVFLSDLKPNSVEFGFAEPRMDANWQGAPVVMGGTAYPKAIGTHAWTVLRFDVPRDALLLQAVVGLSDEMRACEAASVQFEVRTLGNAILWQSPVIDFATPPMPVEIPVGNQRQLILVTSEAGDGRDCDHGNWGGAAFLLKDAARPASPSAGGVGRGAGGEGP
jgi:4-amino-4-deoxy-L-arabinose transferase-like glycosyltransferase